MPRDPSARTPGSPTAAPARWPERLRVGLAPGLLALVASTQIALSLGSDLSPWKGGGFGMFASSDRTRMRIVRAVVGDGAQEWGVPIPGSLDSERLRAQVWPRPSSLAVLAQRLADARAAQGEPALRRIEVWRIEVGGPDLLLQPVPIASAEPGD